ncbi:MAG: hypothetical protein IPH75_01010 [bacterium]|nr:hypothetical protein [bacterium]
MFFRILLTSLILSSSLFAQAKVGTTGAQFLEMMPSVRSLGMGEVAAPLIDRQSHYTNPATLGLSGDYALSFTFRPIPSELSNSGSGVDYQSLGLASHVASLKNGWNLHLGLQAIRLSSGTLIERTYQQGTYEGTGREFEATSNAYAVTAALSSGSHIAYGFGGTFRYVEEDFNDFTADGIAYDLGAIVRIPLKTASVATPKPRPLTSLTAGISLKNMGADIEFIDNSYPLPSSLVFGLALEMNLSRISLVAAMQEQMTTELTEGEVGLGLECGLYDFLWLRLGRTPNGDFDNLATLGSSLSVRGLLTQTVSAVAESSSKGLFSRLDLIASYATSIEDRDVLNSGIDYWQIEIVL